MKTKKILFSLLFALALGSSVLLGQGEFDPNEVSYERAVMKSMECEAIGVALLGNDPAPRGGIHNRCRSLSRWILRVRSAELLGLDELEEALRARALQRVDRLARVIARELARERLDQEVHDELMELVDCLRVDIAEARVDGDGGGGDDVEDPIID